MRLKEEFAEAWTVIGVTDAVVRLVGLLTVENLGEMMMVNAALAKPTELRKNSLIKSPQRTRG